MNAEELKYMKKWIGGGHAEKFDFHKLNVPLKPFHEHDEEAKEIILFLIREIDRLQDVCKEFIYNESET